MSQTDNFAAGVSLLHGLYLPASMSLNAWSHRCHRAELN